MAMGHFVEQRQEVQKLLKHPVNLVSEVMKFVHGEEPHLLPFEESQERTEYYKVLFDLDTLHFKEHVLKAITAKIVGELASRSMTKKAEVIEQSPSSVPVKISPGMQETGFEV